MAKRTDPGFSLLGLIAERDKLETDLYALAEWEHAKHLLFGGWTLGLPARQQPEARELFCLRWLAAEERRIFPAPRLAGKRKGGA